MRKIFLFFVVLILNANFAFGATVVNNTVNGCNDSVNLYAMFEPNVYSCDSGYYLPANVEGCKPCPAEDTCVGGTFTFNEYFSKGIVYNQNITTDIGYGCQSFDGYATAVFEPNEHTCSTGYYLPANIDGCTECPSGSACVGGTYSFNETTDQGIQSCTSGTFSPTGSSVCYPHILHVGDDVVYMRPTKLTTPSLNIDINQDGVADFFINMTTVPTTMNKDSTHYLHVQWENNDYYICDDTTCPNAE